MTRIAWLGVGHLATYCVPPLVERFGATAVTLSPRGREAAESLAGALGLTVAADNHSLIEQADVVLLATRPSMAAEALKDLPWRPDHLVISLCAGLPLAALKAGPARLARAMPVLAARWGESPTCLYPASPLAEAVIGAFGPVIPLAQEALFEPAAVAAVFYSSLVQLSADLTAWTEQAGLPPEQARLLVTQMVRAAGTLGREDGLPLAGIATQLCSPGSFSQAFRESLREAGALTAWTKACAATLAALRREP